MTESCGFLWNVSPFTSYFTPSYHRRQTVLRIVANNRGVILVVYVWHIWVGQIGSGGKSLNMIGWRLFRSLAQHRLLRSSWVCPVPSNTRTKLLLSHKRILPHTFLFVIYRGADKSLARPGRKQANVSVKTAWISFGALPCRKKKKLDDSSRLHVVQIARDPDMLPSMFPSWSG